MSPNSMQIFKLANVLNSVIGILPSISFYICPPVSRHDGPFYLCLRPVTLPFAKFTSPDQGRAISCHVYTSKLSCIFFYILLYCTLHRSLWSLKKKKKCSSIFISSHRVYFSSSWSENVSSTQCTIILTQALSFFCNLCHPFPFKSNRFLLVRIVAYFK